MAICDFIVLKVKTVTDFGAFLEWRDHRDVFVPKNQQKVEMQQGMKYVVRISNDNASKRNIATAKIDRYLEAEVPAGLYQQDQKVDIIIFGFSDLGAKVVVDGKYQGLVYTNEIFKKLEISDQMNAYIKCVREDGKLDIALQQYGYKGVEGSSAKIFDDLREAGGFLPFNDKSSPEEIKNKFQVSKKVFKKAIGALFKKRKITIKDDGIYMVKN